VPREREKVETNMSVKKSAATAATVAKTADKPANIAPATEFSTSGAAQQVPPIDMSHPAVETDPREGTSVQQNQIDFNDPTLSDADAVAQQLAAQK
jgi:hypothetical protein